MPPLLPQQIVNSMRARTWLIDLCPEFRRVLDEEIILTTVCYLMFVSLLDSYLSLPLDNKVSRIVAISALLTIVSLYLLSRRLSTNVYLMHFITTIWEMQKKKNHIKRAILIALGLWKYDWFFSIYKKNYNGKWSYKLKFTIKPK